MLLEYYLIVYIQCTLLWRCLYNKKLLIKSCTDIWTKEPTKPEIELDKGLLLLSQYNTRVWFLSFLQKRGCNKKESSGEITRIVIDGHQKYEYHWFSLCFTWSTHNFMIYTFLVNSFSTPFQRPCFLPQRVPNIGKISFLILSFVT